MPKLNEERFLKDVSKHEMTVVLDNGVHRHLRFAKPGSSDMHFNLVTWPGYLAYTGDMGAFVFQRLPDMFQFFRTDRRTDERLGINPDYWCEKLEAVQREGRNGGFVQYSEEKLRQCIEDDVRNWIEDKGLDKEQIRRLRLAVQDDVLAQIEDDEHTARKAVNDFNFEDDGNTFEFVDSWEWDCEEFTLRFLWCCYALAWGIKQYDAHLSAAAPTVEVQA